ncbi:MAG: magnesium transporter MgtE [Selenomonadaceae bacterium]|nr:magnesium transporter MgtE [Selenomonadaceae bacterium]
MAKKNGGIVGKIVKFLLFLLLLLILTVGGFAAGVYFQLIDAEQTQEINKVLGLYKLPVVGEFFDKPEGVEDEEIETTVTEVDTTNINTVANGGNPYAGASAGDNRNRSRDVTVSQKDIEKMAQEREAAEKKRISKLARIYNNMKAEEAAQALGNLDYDTAILILQKMDEGAVGQILAKMDPSQAAQITQLLFEGTQSRVVLPSDLMQGRDANEDTERVQSNAQ